MEFYEVISRGEDADVPLTYLQTTDPSFPENTRESLVDTCSGFMAVKSG